MSTVEEMKKPIHHKYEALFVTHYPIFQMHLDTTHSPRRSAEHAHKMALFWLEMNCSGKYGFPGELHHSEKHEDSCFMIPTSFESALLLPFVIEEGVDTQIIKSLTNAICIMKRPQTGFWGYFAPVDEEDTCLFPEDIEDTSLSMLALYITGLSTKKQCQDNARKMMECTLKDESGAMGTWLQNLDRTPSGQPRKILYSKPLKDVKVDANCLVNTLLYMSIVGFDDDKNLKPSVNYISNFIDNLIKLKGQSSIVDGMLYYPNKYPIFLFISRYVHHSTHANYAFGSKFRNLVQDEIMAMNLQWSKAMDVACCILAALYLNFHVKCSDGEQTKKINKKLKEMFEFLITLQHDDGSFSKGVLFKMTHFGHYGGSKAISTGLAMCAIGRYMRKSFKI